MQTLALVEPPRAVTSSYAAPRGKPDKDWMSRKEAAAFLSRIGCPIAPQTLAKLAANNNRGKGPSFTRFRWKTVCYKRTDLEEWAKRETVFVR